jgi:predicted nucleic acid-binding protein
MNLAAQLWAEARLNGLPTDASSAMDGDVILAAQAKALSGMVLTTNKKHLSRFVPVAVWQSFQI